MLPEANFKAGIATREQTAKSQTTIIGVSVPAVVVTNDAQDNLNTCDGLPTE